MNFFGPSSVASPVINRACDPSLLTADWGAITEFGDFLRTCTPEEASDAIKVVRKKLTSKNPKVVILALTLLDASVKNGDFKTHSAVASKTVMGTMAKLCSAKNEDVATKSRELVQQWGLSFQALHNALPQFNDTYQMLIAKGTTFPPIEATAPIFTPPSATSTFDEDLADVEAKVEPAELAPPPGIDAEIAAGALADPGLHPTLVTADHAPADAASRLQRDYDKLADDLGRVRDVAADFAVMLVEGDDRESEQWLDAEDFLQQCVPRLHDLVQAGSAGSLTEEAFEGVLQTNDMVNKVLARAVGGEGAATDDELSAMVAVVNAEHSSDEDDDDDSAGEDLLGLGAGAGGSVDVAQLAAGATPADDLASLFTAAAPATPATASAAAPASAGSSTQAPAVAAAAAPTSSLPVPPGPTPNLLTSAAAPSADDSGAMPPPVPLAAATSTEAAMDAFLAEEVDVDVLAGGADDGDELDLDMDELDSILES